MNLREYAFDRFRESFMAAEQKQNIRAVREIVFIAVDRWKKDYRLLAAVWLFLIQRWIIAAENHQYDLANNYGPMLELICTIR